MATTEIEIELVAVDLPCDLHAPARAREALGAAQELGWQLGDAMLVASELVTNALQHSGCDATHQIELRVRRTANRLFISVCDPGASGRSAREESPADIGSGGVGLWMVAQLAHRWGTERRGDYCVWAELALGPAPPAV
jgi:serine/threonine-protein kinase RsbW